MKHNRSELEERYQENKLQQIANEKHPIGKCRVEIYNSVSGKCDWHEGKILGVNAALDRDYRVHVKLLSGFEILEAAPECVEKM